MSVTENSEKAQNNFSTPYHSFWNWFAQHAQAFHKVVKQQDNVEADFLNKLAIKLNEMKEGIYYLTGMHNDNSVELILTPDGVVKNIAFIEDLVESAPDMKGWLFTAMKPAVEGVSIEMEGHRFEADKISFYPNEDPAFPDLVDITVVYPGLTEQNRAEVENGIFIFLDNYLGELRFSTGIDRIDIKPEKDKMIETIPISKLQGYLVWREKEFVEKYDAIKFADDDSEHALFKAKLKNGNILLALMNTDALVWAGKPAYPWILSVTLKYPGSSDGMPNDEIQNELDKLEEELAVQLADCIRIGRQTGDGAREVYFASRDFRLPSQQVDRWRQNNGSGIEVDYDLYKDKYWQSFSRFMPQPY